MTSIEPGGRGPAQIRPTSSVISWASRWDHLLARLGVNRSGHRVPAGLYAMGDPTPESPVFVTANYTLSFDALRAALGGVDGFILVLDTQGINVWCAAGKGTFGTDELVRRIESTGLHDVVSHRTLILPQLSAPGVAGHELPKRSGFMAEYGPVRASDLPAYLATRRATPEMRRVRFTLRDRLVLIPVELRTLLPLLALVLALRVTGIGTASVTDLGWLVAIVAGLALFPILLPWLPTRDFGSKGFILGGIVALPFAVAAWLGHSGEAWWRPAGVALATLLVYSPLTAYIALNFTGSTTFASRSRVRREIFHYIPIMAASFGVGVGLGLLLAVI